MKTHSKKVCRVADHNCTLPVQDDLITIYINGGFCINFRRIFRQYLMVSRTSPESKVYLKSTFQIRTEESRHLRKYYNMIHPFSEFRMTWELVMIVIYFGHFVLMPIEIGMPITSPQVIYVKLFCDVISLVDIVLWFVSGYYDVNMNKVVMMPKKVVKHYFFPWFLLDFVGSLPYNFVIYLINGQKQYNNVKLVMLVRLSRIPTFLNYIKKASIRMDMYTFRLTTMNFFFWFFFLIWWGTALALRIYIQVRGKSFEYFQRFQMTFDGTLETMCTVVEAFLLIHISNIQYNHYISMCFNMLCIWIGAVLNMFILAQVTHIYKGHSDGTNEYDNMMEEVEEYMAYKALPTPIKNRVVSYVQFKFQKSIYNEEDILNTLSRSLKQDVLLHNCKTMVEKVDFLKSLPRNLILHLVTKLKSEIYLPSDVIVQAGIPGNAMYFIYVGSVAVYTLNEKEICHLEDGDHFGEIALIINEPRVASVVAISNCEVFRLSRKDFLETMEPYPMLCSRIKEAALARLKDTQQIEEEKEENEEKVSNTSVKD